MASAKAGRNIVTKMNMLEDYSKKRDFRKTPEPQGKKKSSKRKDAYLRFVIQKHDASRLHYDFRLETKEGVLKSWAVPRGISLDPSVKRLAILTEDHPLDYLLFEGIIPEGNYGAGTVIVWDTGHYTTEKDLDEQFREGKISVTLFGQKAKGSFTLVKMNKENQWLLVKASDEFSGKEDLVVTKPESVISKKVNSDLDVPALEVISKGIEQDFPRTISPMLATPVDKPFDNKDWIFELKWDGVRCTLFLNKPGQILDIRSRKGNSITHRYPEIAEAAKKTIKCDSSVVLDGEIVVLDKDGHPDFQQHQKRMNVDHEREIAFLSREIPATYYVFDILYIDGKNVQGLNLIERRKILSGALGSAEKDRIRISDFIEENGVEFFNQVKKIKLEGIVAKYKFGKYVQGTRSSSWLKIKNIVTQDCVVIGYTAGEGNRQDYFGSLILAVNSGGKLRFAGHTGSGFDFDQLKETYNELQELRIDRCPIDYVPYVNRKPFWLKPQLVVEVKFSEWTREAIMRAPIFLRFREDKLPSDCIIETPKDLEKVIGQDLLVTASKPVPFSNLNKVFWPHAAGHPELTKKDLIAYYEKIASHLLPHLKDRPLSLSRYPDGILGKSFYHKDWTQKKPEFVKTVRIFSNSKNDVINYIVCNNKETLLWLANLGCIEMHPWYSRIRNFESCDSPSTILDEEKCGLDFPDFIIFDLDPYIYSGKERKGEEPEYNVKGFKAAADVAHALKDLLDGLKIRSFIKTSGKTGLHVFVPIEPFYNYDQTRDFAEIVGKILLRRHPNSITMEWNVDKRKGKVFFDHNQNARGKTIASVFSARPTVSATVSMPVGWDRLHEVLPTDFTMQNVSEIIKNSNPWIDILSVKQDIRVILQNVSEIV